MNLDTLILLMNEIKYTVVDDNGYIWVWDGKRIYSLEGEKEFIELGIDIEQNGYGADTEDEAVAILISGGYIKEDPRG